MIRRDFIRYLSGCGLLGAQAVNSPNVFAQPLREEEYQGRFFVTLQAEGAWDVASFCDPKLNQPGEPIINEWARDAGISRAGKVRYANYANNVEFFSRHYKDMLVINGIDSQTNSHTTGVIHNWSGRNSAGYPSLTALFSAIHGSNLPLAYLNFGGYSETAKLIRYSQLNDLNAVLAVLTPNEQLGSTATFHHPDRLEKIMNSQQAKLTRMRERRTKLPHELYTMGAYFEARENRDRLKPFAEAIPAERDREAIRVLANGYPSNLFLQMQTSLLAFKSNASCAADIVLPGFDTHSDHDFNHEPLLGHLTDALIYFWEYANELGIADRITLLVASDFGRTPFYNSNAGKDHWAIGSAIVMEQDAPWANRVIGGTDELLNGKQVLPHNLKTVSQGGSVIYPRHVHNALRSYLGLEGNEITSQYPLDESERLDFFAV